METTRHFTATVYAVHVGAVALHEHPRLGIRIPAGGHVDRDELPHEAGLREVREEMGLEPTLLGGAPDVPAPDGYALPDPEYLMCYDINVHEDGRVGHQHVDHLYFATVPSRDVDPAPGEEPASAWSWFDAADLWDGDLDADTVRLGLEAIEAAGERA